MGVFEGLPAAVPSGPLSFAVRAPREAPRVLEITAETEDGVIMGVRHRELPIEAVQFHPESLLSQDGEHGLKLMENMVRLYGRAGVRSVAGS